MRRPQRGLATLAVFLTLTLLGSTAQCTLPVRAQEATPDAAPAATPLPGAQIWQVLVNNVSPEGENWSFNALYPDQIQAHPGDTIIFTLAPNQSAYHAVQILVRRLTPMELYQGFAGGFRQPDLTQPGHWQSTLFGVNSGVLVNPPASGEGNTSFTLTLDPRLPPGPYYLMSPVDGPAMIARIDLLAPDQPVQSHEQLQITAGRQYQADLVTLAGLDRVSNPPEASNPDGAKIWQVDAGMNAPNKPWLSVNEFSPATMMITAYSDPSAPSGDPYVDGGRTSVLLLPEEYLDSPVGDGLPYASSDSVNFPNPGTCTYECAIHPGMTGTVIVVPKPMPM